MTVRPLGDTQEREHDDQHEGTMDMETKSEETVDGFTRIGEWLWGMYPSPQHNFTLRLGSPKNPQMDVIVQREDVPRLIGLLMVPFESVVTPDDPDPDAGLLDLAPSSRELRETRDRFRRDHDSLNSAHNRLCERVSDLAGVVSGLSEVVQSLQKVVAENQNGSPPAVVASDFATKDFVDQAIRRLNGALREHIRRTFEQAIRAAAPGPGLLTRLKDALWPLDSTSAAKAQGNAARLDPERAVALGAEAARKAVGE